jgi:proline iminopeptidase
MRALIPVCVLMVRASGLGLASPKHVPEPLMRATTPREGYINVASGVTLWYEVHGRGRDTVIVPFASWMAPLLEPLDSGRTVIYYDMRSRGKSSAVTDTALLGIDFEVQDLEAVRAFFHADRPAVIGFSYLGAISALYAARHPDHVSRLILISPLSPKAATAGAAMRAAVTRLDTGKVRALNEALRANPQSRGPRELCRQFWDTMLPLYLGTSGDARGATAAVRATCDLPNESPDRFQATLQTIFTRAGDWNWSAEAGAIRARTLVIQGDADLVAPAASGGEWAAAIPGARLLTVHGGGHLALTESSALILGAVGSFLNGQWPEAAHPVTPSG